MYQRQNRNSVGPLSNFLLRLFIGRDNKEILLQGLFIKDMSLSIEQNIPSKVAYSARLKPVVTLLMGLLVSHSYFSVMMNLLVLFW